MNTSTTIPEDRLSEIATLNAKSDGTIPPLRADCSDVQLEEARAQVFELEVRNEAYRQASQNGVVAVKGEQVNALLPLIRARMKVAALADLSQAKTGVLGKLKQAQERLAEIESERELLAREEEDLVQRELQLESMQHRRSEYIACMESARERVKAIQSNLMRAKADSAGLFLAKWDNAHGSDVLGAIYECYEAMASGEKIVADLPRLEAEWQAGLKAKDAEIAAFQKTYGIQ